ncbi:MAG: SusE domain-containing protein, partial [Proteiniphilum sp.]|nr:SusE domain-containing protein [Proteiniphilum sp.]
MKTIYTKLIIFSSLVFGFLACSSDGEVRDMGVTPVKTLYEPTDGRTLVLQSSASAMLYFEWEPARAEDSGAVLYEIAFDKANGDFSDPLSIIAADNNGGSNHATITHKQLNQIAALAGIESAAQGTLKWTVYASKGINPVKAGQERTITVTRLAGFANIPEQLFITGTATEAGNDLSKAIRMKKINDGEFEVYTRLTQGQSFQFTNASTGTPVVYSL